MIRVVVAEDSATSRALIVALLSAEPDMRVVGEAATGQEAVDLAVSLEPDLITMDVHMPGLDGIDATREIMTRSPRPIIVVSATARTAEVELSLEATRAGALMVLPKPEGPASREFASDRRQLVSMVRAMSQVKVVRRHGVAPHAPERPRPRITVASDSSRPPVRLVAIAASTGGPAALRDVFGTLPRSFGAPILVTQHIAHGFTAGLASWLAGDTGLRVKVAELGEMAEPGTVYIAPEDRHLGCRENGSGALRLVLDASPPVGAFRPSATWMFQSCTQAVGSALVAVVLTGMGDDGVAALRAARGAGAHVIAQDEQSSVIYGMPREAARTGMVQDILPLDAISRRLKELVA